VRWAIARQACASKDLHGYRNTLVNLLCRDINEKALMFDKLQFVVL
jgi:hypothetical protein